MAARSLSFSTSSTFARASQCEYRLSSSVPSSLTKSLRPESFHNPWLGTTTKLSIQAPNLRPQLPKHRPIAATVSFSLPTGKPDRVSHGKVPKWSSKAIKSFAMAELEARKLKYPTTGTEALLMGILIEGTNLAAKFLMTNGITLFKLREETIKLLGKADLFFFSPEHPPLTESAQRALDWAVDEKLKSDGSGEITTIHLLLGIWSEKESAGHKILASLGFEVEKARELETLISDPGFVDD